MESQILEFVKHRFPNLGEDYWNNGNCYYFALILSKRFDLEIYYDCIMGHFVAGTKIGNELMLFDINGRYYPENGAILSMKQLKKDSKQLPKQSQ